MLLQYADNPPEPSHPHRLSPYNVLIFNLKFVSRNNVRGSEASLNFLRNICTRNFALCHTARLSQCKNNIFIIFPISLRDAAWHVRSSRHGAAALPLRPPPAPAGKKSPCTPRWGGAGSIREDISPLTHRLLGQSQPSSHAAAGL